MSARARHIEEMRFLVAHRCATLAEARAGLARLKWQAGQAALAKVQGDDRLPSGGEFLRDQPPADQSKFWWDRD